MALQYWGYIVGFRQTALFRLARLIPAVNHESLSDWLGGGVETFRDKRSKDVVDR